LNRGCFEAILMKNTPRTLGVKVAFISKFLIIIKIKIKIKTKVFIHKEDKHFFRILASLV
jgi:hypothetical protein